MSYLGNNPTLAVVQSTHQVLSGITFNGVSSTFPLTVGGVPQFPGDPANVIISINGVLQAPVDAYNISGSNIVFTSVPPAGSSFAGIVLGTTYQTNVPLPGSVGSAELQLGAVNLSGDRVSSVLPVGKGGTGSATATDALTALGGQQALVSGTNIKTINNVAVLGTGNIDLKTINSIPLTGTGNIETFTLAQAHAAALSF